MVRSMSGTVRRSGGFYNHELVFTNHGQSFQLVGTVLGVGRHHNSRWLNGFLFPLLAKLSASFVVNVLLFSIGLLVAFWTGKSSICFVSFMRTLIIDPYVHLSTRCSMPLVTIMII